MISLAIRLCGLLLVLVYVQSCITDCKTNGGYIICTCVTDYRNITYFQPLSPERVPWSIAADICRDNGVTLLYIEDEHENKRITNLLKNRGVTRSWMGLVCGRGCPGQLHAFLWEGTNETWAYENPGVEWSYGMSGQRGAIEIDGSWSLVDPDVRLSYICKLEESNSSESIVTSTDSSMTNGTSMSFPAEQPESPATTPPQAQGIKDAIIAVFVTLFFIFLATTIVLAVCLYQKRHWRPRQPVDKTGQVIADNYEHLDTYMQPQAECTAQPNSAEDVYMDIM